jgi:hypothetical protein
VDEPTIKCKKCGNIIKLTDAVAAPLLESAKAQFDRDLANARTQIEQDAMHVATQRVELALAATKANANAAALKAANEASVLRLSLAEQERKLAEAQREQARLLAKEHELDEARREMELTIARQVQAASASIRDQARATAESEIGLKVAEREEQIAAMGRQIDDLKRRAEQGSQQMQGEAQEIVLEQMLKARFPMDLVEPIAKGVFGGDVIQRVLGPSGQPCGSILFESKRTKTWTAGWLPKLREDQRAAKAEIALLVTQVMPKSDDGQTVVAFDLIEGIWVCEWRCAIAVAVALRQSLIEVAGARAAGVGQKSKSELVYAYLTGNAFKMRIGAVVEKFSMMADDLAAERKAITRMWAKREGQIQGALDAAVGLHGDLSAIAGKQMPEVEGLGMKELK